MPVDENVLIGVIHCRCVLCLSISETPTPVHCVKLETIALKTQMSIIALCQTIKKDIPAASYALQSLYQLISYRLGTFQLLYNILFSREEIFAKSEI